MWAAVRGGVGVACRTGGRQYWPTPWPSAVVASVRVAGVLAGGPCRWYPSAVVAVGPWLVSVRGRGGRFRGRWRPFGRPLVHWSAVGLSRPVAARLGLVCLPCHLVVFRRRLHPSPLVCGGGACVPMSRRRWSRWPCRWPSLLVSLVSVSLRRAVARGPCRWPPVWAAVWRCAGGVIAPSLFGPCAVSVRPCWCPPWRSLAVSVRPCWCAGMRSAAGVRFLPFSLPVAARLGRRWCWCPSLVLAARVGLVLGLADWLAVWALPVVAAVAGGACACGGACLVNERRPVAGWRWAVCGAFRGGGVRLPCLWSLLVSRQRRPWAVRLSKDQTPAAAVAALLVVCVTCLRWRRWCWRRWSRPCASRPTCGGRPSVCRRRCIRTRRRTGWR